MQVRVDARLEEAMRAHALVELPQEACGAVFGQLDARGDAVATVYRPLRNRSARPLASFAVDPIELCAIEGAERDDRRTLLGLFHAHPSGSAAPSSTDCGADWPGHVCWIGASDGEGGFLLLAYRLLRSRLACRSAPDRSPRQKRIV